MTRWRSQVRALHRPFSSIWCPRGLYRLQVWSSDRGRSSFPTRNLVSYHPGWWDRFPVLRGVGDHWETNRSIVGGRVHLQNVNDPGDRQDRLVDECVRPLNALGVSGRFLPFPCGDQFDSKQRMNSPVGAAESPRRSVALTADIWFIHLKPRTTACDRVCLIESGFEPN